MSKDLVGMPFQVTNDYELIYKYISDFLLEAQNEDLSLNNILNYISPILSMYKANNLITQLDDYKIIDSFKEIQLYMKNGQSFIIAAKLDKENVLIRFDNESKEIYKVSMARTDEPSYHLIEDMLLSASLYSLAREYNIPIAKITTKHLSGV
jgi:hypothetical protein